MLQDNEKIPRILVLARNSKASLQRLQGFLLVLCLKHTEASSGSGIIQNSMLRCIKFAKLSRSSPLNSELLETGISSWKVKDNVQIMIDDERLPKTMF